MLHHGILMTPKSLAVSAISIVEVSGAIQVVELNTSASSSTLKGQI